MEGISGTRNPVQLGWSDTAAEEVALPHRVEGGPKGISVIKANILDEWGNSFLNLNSVTTKNTISDLREGRDETEEAASERTQLWDFDTDRVVAVGEITSQVRLGYNSSKAQFVLSKPKDGRLGSTTRGPYAPHASSVKGFYSGPDVEQVVGHVKGSSQSSRSGICDACARGGGTGGGDHGSAIWCAAVRRREAGWGLALANVSLPLDADDHPLPPLMMKGSGRVCADAVGAIGGVDGYLDRATNLVGEDEACLGV
ncbi:hypothetical protein HN51_028967 [Arachis hypogaea]